MSQAVLLEAATEAIGIGDLSRLKRLVEKGLDVRDAGGESSTLLHWACQSGHLDIARYLVEQGLHLDAKDAHGATPLSAAVAARSPVELLAALIRYGANVCLPDHEGRTALHMAAMDRTAHATDVIRCLVVAGAQVDVPDVRGNTPLHVATQRGALAACMALLHSGARADHRNQAGQDPMDILVQAGRIDQAEEIRAWHAARLAAQVIEALCTPKQKSTAPL